MKEKQVLCFSRFGVSAVFSRGVTSICNQPLSNRFLLECLSRADGWKFNIFRLTENDREM